MSFSIPTIPLKTNYMSRTVQKSAFSSPRTTNRGFPAQFPVTRRAHGHRLAPLQRRGAARGAGRVAPGLVQRAAALQAQTRQGLGQPLLGLPKNGGE